MIRVPNDRYPGTGVVPRSEVAVKADVPVAGEIGISGDGVPDHELFVILSSSCATLKSL